MKQQLFSQVRMAAVSLSFLVLLIALPGCDDYEEEKDNRPYTISGDGDGAQMVPSVTGTGTGTINGTYNPSTRELTYTSNWSGLTGAPASGGFFRGGRGVSGTAEGTPWTFQSGSTETGSVNGTMTLTDQQATELLGNNWYYSFGTAMNPGGEVRGQISATR
jgi:hypothetical protein